MIVDAPLFVDGAGVSSRRARGTGRVPTLLLVHGAEMGPRFFDPLLAALVDAGAGEVIAPALPGRDGSALSPRDTVEEMARFVLDAAAQAVDGPFVLAGHSLGGAVALAGAIAAAAPAPDGARAIPLAGLALLATGARLRVHPAILGLAERRVADPGSIGPLDAQLALATPAVRALLAAATDGTPPATALADWRAADAFDRLGQLQPLRRSDGRPLPTWVLVGADDRLTPPRYAAHLAEALAGTLRLLPGEGHLFPATAPAATAAHLVELLRAAV